MDAKVTVWLTSQKNPESWNAFDNAGRVLSKTAVNSFNNEIVQCKNKIWEPKMASPLWFLFRDLRYDK